MSAEPSIPARRPGFALAALAAALLALLALLALAPLAQARVTRAHEGSVGLFAISPGEQSPRRLAVDQSSGDLYVAEKTSSNLVVHRFDDTGAPKNFTVGPDTGTNILTGIGSGGFISGAGSIAVDNSGGSLDGTVYVTRQSGSRDIAAFAASGALLGVIDGSGTGGTYGSNSGPCAIAVDQTDGSLYIAQEGTGSIWRYRPTSPGGPISDADYTVTGISADAGCAFQSLAAHDGAVYGITGSKVLRSYEAAAFATTPPSVTGEVVLDYATAVAIDPATGEIYVNRGNGILALDSDEQPQYSFGAAAYFGVDSKGLAVDSAASGPAEKIYVSDNTSSDHTVETFGALTNVPSYTHFEQGSFGPDGSGASSFPSSAVNGLTFASTAQRLYVLGIDGGAAAPGLYGFDASSPPPPFTPLGAFSPLGTVNLGQQPGIAVDNTALASQGNVYVASENTDQLYGFDDSGAPLAGFPVDPATNPGAPDGSPANLCGATVDATGNVWVSNSQTSRVLKYSSAGAYLGAIDTSAAGKPCQLALDSSENLYVTVSAAVHKLSAASGYVSGSKIAGLWAGYSAHLAVDAASDHLLVANRGSCASPGCGFGGPPSFTSWLDEYDETGTLIDEHPLQGDFAPRGIALDPASGNVYVSRVSGSNSPPPPGNQIQAIGPGLILPEPTAKPATALANDSATLNATVGSQGVAVTGCRFEYVSLAAHRVSGFSDLSSGGSEDCDPAAASIPLDFDQHPVSAPATGLETNTAYRFRLVVENADGETVAEGSLSSAGPPEVETTGAPIRGAAGAQLTARVHPVREPTDYHFEYGDAGPCDANPCASTPARAAGSGDQARLVAEALSGLTPDTTYHYRVVAENGNPDGPQAGEDMTVTTRASDSLSHGDYPGPPGSNRAWELVSLPDSGGNPTSPASAFSDDGDRAVYGIAGGTPISNSGGFLNFYFAERPAGVHPESGWQPRLVSPAREDMVGPGWYGYFGGGGLSASISGNSAGTGLIVEKLVLWRLRPDGAPQELFRSDDLREVSGLGGGNTFDISADGSRAVAVLQGAPGTLDPAFPGAATSLHLYDIGADPPQLLSLLPGGAPPQCGLGANGAFISGLPHAANFLSADGSLLYFPSRGDNCADPIKLYLRDLDSGQTKLIGPGALVKATPGAAFFTTTANLDPARDNGGGGNDLYRYDLASESLECLTCLVEGLDTDIQDTTVAEDGSRVYFRTAKTLLPGASAGTYRLAVPGGELDFVWDTGPLSSARISTDGSKLAFTSAGGGLNPVGGIVVNGAKEQAYLYDDEDRSLTCASCPQDGSPPGAAVGGLGVDNTNLDGFAPNLTALADDGTLAYRTASALVGADQNTPGPGGDPDSGFDVYEYRDGRVLLVTDGVTSWPFKPAVQGISRSGEDIFFNAPVAYTADAIDNNNRLYTARIGGGIDFPPAGLPPCDLNSGACEGAPSTGPDQAGAGTAAFAGPGSESEPFRPSCAPFAQLTRRHTAAARRLRARLARAVRRARGSRPSRVTRRRVARLRRAAKRRAVAAKRLRNRAARCRSRNRANDNRRTSR